MTTSAGPPRRRAAILLGGPLLLGATLVLPAPGTLPSPGWHVAGLAAWMALWWLTAIVPLEATALLPVVVLPLTGRAIGEVTGPYANPIIFLFLGGFFLAATLERWGLHRRFAIATLHRSGTRASRILLAFMLASAFLSMWISNTATAVMMLPIANAVAVDVEQNEAGTSGRFAVALMLGIAYACSIGGVVTLIGTPPNAMFAGAARELLGLDIDFGRWMGLGLLAAAPMLFLCWGLLLRLFDVRGDLPGLADIVARERASFGPLTGGERYVIGVCTVTAIAWVLRVPKTIGAWRVPGLTDWLPGLTDPGIAIGGALLLFVVPLPRSRFRVALNWESARAVPWGILLLFGGGLSLAAAFADSGLTAWIGGALAQLQGSPTVLIYGATAALFIFLTELTSNTATAALGMPLMAGVAAGLDMAPLPLMAVAALASSMAFMLPVATPPNAIVFASGRLTPRDMARAGWWLNLSAIIVVTLAVSLWV